MSDDAERFTLPHAVVTTIDTEARLLGVSRAVMLHQLICRALMSSRHLYKSRSSDGTVIPRRPYMVGYDRPDAGRTGDSWTMLLELTAEDYQRLEHRAQTDGNAPEHIAVELIRRSLPAGTAEVATDG